MLFTVNMRLTPRTVEVGLASCKTLIRQLIADLLDRKLEGAIFVHIYPYYTKKGLPKIDSPLTVLIKLKVVAGEGFEPPTFGL